MLLTRKSESAPASGPRLKRQSGARMSTMDRRTFLKRSGLAAGAGAFASQLPYGAIGQATAAAEGDGKSVVNKRTICTHCSVGCAVDATVENGVWTRQNPVFESPINLGAHCAKGASIREHGMVAHSHRLKTPMKLVNGQWQRLSWEQALNEVSAKLLEIRKDSGPDAVFWVGSSKHNNEQAYLMRKFVSFWGTNNCDHQARICHSTTVAGVANTWGYGAMTNSYNDMQNTKCALYIGSNAAEAHPVSMLHMLHAKETGAKMIVVDPRFTRTAAKADEYVRIRSGTDIPFIFGMLYHIFKNGWEDKKYISDRVYGMDKVRDEVLAKWTPDKVEEVCGVPEAQVLKVAEMMAKNKPSTIVWCMGQTQHTIGNAIVRASCILQFALGNVGVSGGGTNIFRGHDNVQGATDVGPNPDSLPGYYGLATGSWKYWAGVWGVDYEWIKKQYAEGQMEKNGMTVSRWIDGVMYPNDTIDQGPNLRAMVYWGHAPEQPDARHRDGRGHEEARSDGRHRPLSVRHGSDVRDGAQGRRLPAAGGDAVGDLRLLHRVEPLAPVARKGHRAAVRVEARPHADGRVRRQVRLQEGTGQELRDGEGQGRLGRAHARIHPEGNQPGCVDHRLHRPVARAPEAAHEEHVDVRREVAARARRPLRRRLLRPAVAVLWNAGTETSRIAEPLRHVAVDDGRRRLLPRQFRCRARRRQAAGRGRVVPKGRRPDHRLPGIRPRPAEEARLVGRPDRRREEEGRGQELEDRHVRRHSACRDEARLPSVRQRQGPRRRVEFPGRHPAAPRAAVFAAAGHGGEVPDARRQEGVLASAHAVQEHPGEERRRRRRQELPVGPHQRTPGRIRRRRRRDALQPVARGAAAGELRRDQSEGRERPWNRRRRIRVGQVADRRADLGQGDDHRPRRRRERPSSRSTSRAGGRERTCSSSTRRAPRRSSGPRP